MYVQHFTIIFQRLEAMGKTFRDEQAAPVGRTELFGMPLQEGRRTGTQVDSDIQHAAAQAGYIFGFGVRRVLEMQPAHGGLAGGIGVVDLCNAALTESRLPLILAP